MKNTPYFSGFGLTKGTHESPAQTYCNATMTKESSGNVPGACVCRLTRTAGQATRTSSATRQFPYGGQCLELESIASCENKACHSTLTALCFGKECEKLGLVSSCCRPYCHCQKEKLCSHAVPTLDTLWRWTRAGNACGRCPMGCCLLRRDCRDWITCNNFVCWLVKL